MGRSISVLGAGSWGTALAILAARNGCRTLLWGHNADHMAALQRQRRNGRYLPDVAFPEELQVSGDLAEAAAHSDFLLVTVPSHAFQQTLFALRPHLSPHARLAWATKGFNPHDGDLLHRAAQRILAPQTPIAVLSGPTFAREVAIGLPTAITIASPQADFADQLADMLRNPRFRVYTSSDIVGVQIGGAVKNVLAIAAGIADGLDFGANTRAALITRGLAEIMRLGLALNGKQETFMGLAGLGDLVLTCTDNQSRNRRFGLALGQGKSPAAARDEINQEVEGIFAAKETRLLAQKHAIDMPITEQTYNVLYCNLEPQLAVHNLLEREPKAENR
ncbi:MAG: NAD(P)H-dependent glycerol-3-phosphate dehydrogenase [Gammaproteobacteria bacterium]